MNPRSFGVLGKVIITFPVVVMTFLVALTTAYTPGAGAKTCEVYDIVASPEPLFTDVEAAMRTLFDQHDDTVRPEADDLFGCFLVLRPDAPELEMRPLLIETMRRLLAPSAYRRNLRDETLALLDLLQTPGGPRVSLPKSVSEHAAYQAAVREVTRLHPDYPQNPSFHAWEFKRAYQRELNREDQRAVPPKPQPLPAAVALRHLRELRARFVGEALRYFFEPADLSFYEQLKYKDGHEEINYNEHRRTLTPDDMDVARFDIAYKKTMRAKGRRLKLGLTKMQGAHYNQGIRAIGEVIEVTPENIGDLAVGSKDFALDTFARPRVYEGRYYRTLMDWLNDAITRLEKDDLGALAELRGRVDADLEQKDLHKRLRRFGNPAQAYWFTRTFKDPEYFRRRDARARELGRPSLLAELRRRGRPRANLWKPETWSAALGSIREAARAMVPRNLQLGRHQEGFTNTARNQIREDDKRMAFTFGSVPWLAPIPFTFDVVETRAAQTFPAWQPRAQPEIFWLESARPVQPIDKVVSLPASSLGQLASLKVTRNGRELVNGRDYVAREDADNHSVFLTFTTDELVDLRMGWCAPDRSYTPAAEEANLDAIAVARFAPVMDELRRGRLDRLAEKIEALTRGQTTVSARRLLWLLRMEARYSFDPDKTATPVRGASGRYAEFSGFLNAGGHVCVQCDGSNALFERIFNQLFEEDRSLRAVVTSGYKREPFVTSITQKYAHARLHIYRDGRRAAVLDATPLLWDLQGLFKKGEINETSPDLEKEAAAAEAHAERDPEPARRRRLALLAERIRSRRAELLAYESVKRAFVHDRTAPVPAAFRITADFDRDERLVQDFITIASDAERYRDYLKRIARGDTKTPGYGLADDRAALATLNALLRDAGEALTLFDRDDVESCAAELARGR